MQRSLKNSPGVPLYNVMFPIWLLWLFPISWLVILPANFAIDLLVVFLTLKKCQVENVRQQTKAVIFRVWLLGFAADFIGTALLFVCTMLPDFNQTAAGEWWYDNITGPVSLNPFESLWALLLIALCVFVSGLCIYWLNRRFGLKKAALSDWQRRKLALSLALFTAPYLFFLPTRWFY